MYIHAHIQWVYLCILIKEHSCNICPSLFSLSPAPSEVVNLQPTSNPFSICVQWSEPEDNGGQMINGYAIHLWNRDDFEMENYVFVSTVSASVLTYTIENLDNDTEYL